MEVKRLDSVSLFSLASTTDWVVTEKGFIWVTALSSDHRVTSDDGFLSGCQGPKEVLGRPW